MNKLISKNPIQRFKQGLKIMKFQNPSLALSLTKTIVRPNGLNSTVTFYPKYTMTQNGKKVGFYKDDGTEEFRLAKLKSGWYDSEGGLYEFKVNTKLKTVPLKNGNSSGRRGSSSKQPVTILPNRAVNGYTLPEGVTNVSEILNLLVKEGYLLPKYKVDGLWGAETQAAWEAKKSFDELQNMKENFGNNHPTPTTISPELQQAFTRTTPDYIGESTNEPLAFLLPQNVNRKYVRSMIRTFGRNPYEDYTPQERILMRNEINNGTFDANKWFGEFGLNNILPTQSDLQTVATSSTNTPPSSLYNMVGFNRFLTNWLNQNPGIYNNLANIFTTHQPSVATPTYVPNYNMNYNENNPLTYRYATSIYKQGGLISKNPVKLFKTNFRKGAL